ncbi:hypothetical protein Btru_044326 [Bulinus truncatus]|nr:hypothetical protein Btru_044326 [Bulinus truncatus]
MSGCLPRWFGKECDRICRCENFQCARDGYCKKNVTCQLGYFGTQCQYKDCITWANVSQVEMKTRTSRRCSRTFTAISPLTITFDHPEVFTWIQVEAESAVNLKNITVTFGGHTNLHCFTGPCPDRRDIEVDNSTLIIMCTISSYVCQVDLTFDGNATKSLCAVYVSGGKSAVCRNLAVRQATNMSSYYEDPGGAARRGLLAVDGVTHGPKCSRTQVGDRNPTWEISFSSTVLLDRVVIYLESIDIGVNFSLRLMNENRITISNYCQTMHTETTMLVRNTDGPVKFIEISVSNTSGTLSICEFEAYGECAPPVYGPDCSELCSASCDKFRCTYEGYCHRCVKGTRGVYCFEGANIEEEYIDLTSTQITLTTTTSPPRRRHAPPLTTTWYYILILMSVLTIVCLAGITQPCFKKPKKLSNEKASLQQKTDEKSLAAEVTGK